MAGEFFIYNTMYTLTLTSEERKAIDWVGDRYSTGDIFHDFLTDLKVTHTPLEAEWSDNCDITFHIPEHIAWGIDVLFEEEDYSFPCFSDDFKQKLLEFSNKIV